MTNYEAAHYTIFSTLLLLAPFSSKYSPQHRSQTPSTCVLPFRWHTKFHIHTHACAHTHTHTKEKIIYRIRNHRQLMKG